MSSPHLEQVERPLTPSRGLCRQMVGAWQKENGALPAHCWALFRQEQLGDIQVLVI